MSKPRFLKGNLTLDGAKLLGDESLNGHLIWWIDGGGAACEVYLRGQILPKKLHYAYHFYPQADDMGDFIALEYE